MRRLLPLVLVPLLAASACATALEEEHGAPIPIRSLPTPSAPELPPTPTLSPTPCDATGVSLTAGLVDAAMGERGLGITLTNCGGKPFRLDGRPAVRLLDDARAPIDVETPAGTQDKPKPLTLKPGETARFVLMWRNTVTDVDKPAIRAPYIEVTPAPGRPAHVVAPDGGVDIGTTGRVEVNAWTHPPS
ncbi:DUF4232 domain-containing protein [Actinomadura atramentaria]|uniref:DUF4232 domain-containing protein n=1 Tax=Actinomadura atramentaria TaxID=1990 RepID=UPI0003622ECE|nr:DUF4232 domain-containing protein [Actinomadura atramentaria]